MNVREEGIAQVSAKIMDSRLLEPSGSKLRPSGQGRSQSGEDTVEVGTLKW